MNDCIEWTKGRSGKGYGVLRHAGRIVYAHRLAFFNHYGYWPEVVRHTCDNPPCVNPDHLLPGSSKDNTRDMVERGRSPKGPLPLNHDMPTPRTTAYRREVYLRQKAGTWIYRKDKD